MQMSRARERRKATEQEHRGAGRAGQERGPGRATEQRNRAGDAGQEAGLGSKAAGQGSNRNSNCKLPQRGEHLSSNTLTF